jgi:hypothetical protein
LHGGILFLMALDVCNASVSFDIDGAQDKLDELTVNDFPGENLTEFMASAQKYVKFMQSGYALLIQTGSKLLMKCTNTDCEFFNRKAYNYLNLVKTMEDGFKLSDPKSMMSHWEYSALGAIGVIDWVQKDHSKFIRHQEWPALASKLSESNTASMTLTCYHHGEDGHIKPNYPKLNDTQRTSNATSNVTSNITTAPNVTPNPIPKAVVEKKEDEQCMKRLMSAWKQIRPFDLTIAHIDNDGKEWKVCTKCSDKNTGNKGLFNLSHWDVDHKDGFGHPAPATNLTMISDPLDNVPVGPPLVTTVETDEELDPHERIFTGAWCCPSGAWCCPSDNPPRGATMVTSIPKQEEAGVSIHDSGPPIPVLELRRDDDSISDEDSSEGESQYG